MADRSVDRMRVMLLNYEYPPLGGGAGIATQSLAESLTERGVKVDVVTAGPDDSPDLPNSLSGDVRGPHVFRVRTSRRELHSAGMMVGASFVLRARPLVRRLLRDAGYDVAHFLFSLPTGALLPLAQEAGLGTVLSLRGSDVPGYDLTKPGLRSAHRILRPLTRSIWGRADRVVAVCTSLGELARETKPDLEFEVIGNGVDWSASTRPAGGRPCGEVLTSACVDVDRETVARPRSTRYLPAAAGIEG